MSYDLSNYLPIIFHRNVDYWNRNLSELGISSAEIPYLSVLHDLGSPTQEQLAARLQVHKSAVTKSIRSMEEKNLVTRIRDEKDARCFRVSLTDKGCKYWEIVEEKRNDWRRDILAGLSEEEIEITQNALIRILKNYDTEKENINNGKE